jgi:L-fuconolactonase
VSGRFLELLTVPDFPIVDAHVHIYDPLAVRFDWMASVPKLNHPHLPSDYKRLTAGVDIAAFVFVEVDAAQGEQFNEVNWVVKQAAHEPRLRGMVASLALSSGASIEEDLARLAAVPLARGVRELVQGHVDEPGWCLRERFVDAVQMLPKHNLSFDLCIVHPQLSDAIELCRRCPDVTFVLDHIGKPGIKAGFMEPWASQLNALAKLPNVWCKISGVVTEADHASWREAEVIPYIVHAISCFGFERVMFGGDWPVSELATPYKRWVDVVDAAVAKASPLEKRKLFFDNANAFYRLGL